MQMEKLRTHVHFIHFPEHARGVLQVLFIISMGFLESLLLISRQSGYSMLTQFIFVNILLELVKLRLLVWIDHWLVIGPSQCVLRVDWQPGREQRCRGHDRCYWSLGKDLFVAVAQHVWQIWN